MPGDNQISTKISSEMKQEAKRLAQRDGMSLSSWVNQQIAEGIRRGREEDVAHARALSSASRVSR